MILDEGPGAGASVVVTAPEVLATAEGIDEPRTFEVRLSSPPTGDVRLPLRVFPPEEAVVSPTELVFSPENWETPQAFVVSGLDDTEDDGARSYEVALAPLESTDPTFAGIDPPDYTMINHDNEYRMVLFDPSDIVDQELAPDFFLYERTALEGGFGPLGDRFGIRVTDRVREGTSVDVTFRLINAEGDASFEVGSEVHEHTISFTPDNYHVAQYVDIHSLDDAVVDDDEISLEFDITTADPVYQSWFFAAQPIAQADDETDGITTSPLATNMCEGATQLATVALNRPPTESVAIDYTSSAGELSIANGSMLLTPNNMSASMTLISAENTVSQNDRQIQVAGVVDTVDPIYVSELAETIAVTIEDDDAPAQGEGEIGQMVVQQTSCR